METNVETNDVNEAVAETTPPAPERQTWFDLVLPLVLPITVIAIAVVGVMLGAYHHVFTKTDTGFAVVDIAAIVKAREAQFTALLSRPNVGDAERMQAYHLVSKIGPEIEGAINELQQECGCVILVKSAVIAGAPDRTGRLMDKLGIGTGE